MRRSAAHAAARRRRRPVLFVTGHAPPDRVGAFARLHEREDVEYALFGGRMAHGGPASAQSAAPAPDACDLPFPHRRVRQADVAALAASGRYRAVVCGTAGRVALPAAWGGARARRVPLLLWTALWAHPRTPAHAASFLALRRLYRSADAVVTYGPHVSRYVRAHGARNVHIAPQAVDNAFWSGTPTRAPNDHAWGEGVGTRFLFVGRPAREKGLHVLLSAWRASGLEAPDAALVLVGVGPSRGLLRAPAGGAPPHPRGAARDGPEIVAAGVLDAVELRNFYAAADVLVLPSIATRKFREPWGLVANEAMNQHVPVIATDAVGAAAGGLVRHGRNGLVVRANDPSALAGALRTLATDARLRERLGAAAARDVRAFTQDAWAAGFCAALGSLGLSRGAHTSAESIILG
jgi:glycosyltransferase involved in cell wall biosynthesis